MMIVSVELVVEMACHCAITDTESRYLNVP